VVSKKNSEEKPLQKKVRKKRKKEKTITEKEWEKKKTRKKHNKKKKNKKKRHVRKNKKSKRPRGLSQADKARILTKHHMVPTSRGGTNAETNIKMVDRLTHDHWHRIFLNWRPDEIIKMLECCSRSVFIRNGYASRKAWEELFGKKTDLQVITAIKNNWSPKE